MYAPRDVFADLAAAVADGADCVDGAQRAWAAGAGPDHGGWLHIDVDATITVDHSDN